MSLYSANSPAIALYSGDTGYAWSSENPAVGSSSQQFALPRAPWASVPLPLSVEIVFAGAPGAFEIDAQTADTDADANYVKETNGAITAVSANNVARLELPSTVARFLRLNLVSLTNPVAITARVTRG